VTNWVTTLTVVERCPTSREMTSTGTFASDSNDTELAAVRGLPGRPGSREGPQNSADAEYRDGTYGRRPGNQVARSFEPGSWNAQPVSTRCAARMSGATVP
jgi:hypothetical protein